MKKKILIIGGSGFIGLNLILKIIRNKYFEVTSVSRSIPNKLKKIKKLKIIKADFTKFSLITKKLKNKKYDFVINLGGNINHKDKKETNESQFILCKNLVDYFKNKNISLFLQGGSSLEYGVSKNKNFENDNCKPNSFYGQSKLKATKYIQKSGINYIILRLYQIYGPYQKVNRIIPLAITQLQENLTFNSTSGLQIRDFLYVDDLTNLILKIIKKKNKTYGIFNVGSGQPITIKKILNKIIEINGGTVFFGEEKMRKDEAKILYPSINKIKKYYNWEPKIKILKGLKKTIKYYEK